MELRILRTRYTLFLVASLCLGSVSRTAPRTVACPAPDHLAAATGLAAVAPRPPLCPGCGEKNHAWAVEDKQIAYLTYQDTFARCIPPPPQGLRRSRHRWDTLSSHPCTLGPASSVHLRNSRSRVSTDSSWSTWGTPSRCMMFCRSRAQDSPRKRRMSDSGTSRRRHRSGCSRSTAPTLSRLRGKQGGKTT